MKKFLFACVLIFLWFCSDIPPKSPQITEETLKERLTVLSRKAVDDLPSVPIDSNAIPRALEADGSLMKSSSRDWTSGFYAGTLWGLYRFSNNNQLGEAAESWTAFQEKEKRDTHTHDLGFKVFCSFGEAYQIKPTEEKKRVIIQASETLIKRYNPKVGAIRSWDFNKEVWQFPVIIDNMMNLKMLFAATQLTGDSTFYDIAYQHAMTTLENHFRPDHSSYHVIDYDTLTGEVRNRHTHQGISHESAWARGQAWGLYGFVMCYGETGESLFLKKAQDIASFFFNHPRLPADKIPYWDFDAPKIPDEFRDASAAAIAASGLLELSQLDPQHRAQYLEWADAILLSLETPEYQSDAPPFLLQHSVGNIPGDSEIDVPIVYADYFYVEALLRRLAIAQNSAEL